MALERGQLELARRELPGCALELRRDLRDTGLETFVERLQLCLGLVLGRGHLLEPRLHLHVACAALVTADLGRELRDLHADVVDGALEAGAPAPAPGAPR